MLCTPPRLHESARNVEVISSWLLSREGQTEDGGSVLDECGASEGLGSDVREVISRRVFDEEDASSLFRVADHGVAGGDPL